MNFAAAWDTLRYALRHRAVRYAALASLVSAFLSAAALAAYWWPAWRTHSALEQAISAKRHAVVAAMSAQEVKKAYESAAKALPVIEHKLSMSRGQSDVVDQLNRLARKRGIRIISESYEEGKAKSAFVPLYLDIALQGSYAEMRGFLADVATLSAWGEVQEVRMEGVRGTPGSVKAHLRLVMYRKGPQVAGLG